MEYFYAPPPNISAGVITIDGDEFVHLSHVMRKKVDDEIYVVNGTGIAFHTTIIEISKKLARCEIRRELPLLHEPSVNVTLAVGIVKNPSRFDFIVEKATELGVNRIVPLLTERTVAKNAKAGRWQKIALAAMKQSGRCVLPRIDPITSLSTFILNIDAELKIIPHEQSSGSMTSSNAPTVAICIGPEGGFTDEEIEQATTTGFQQISLGSRRLRTETASIVAVSKFLSS